MKIEIVCTDPLHPVQPYLRRWIARVPAQHAAVVHASAKALAGGDLLLLIACHEIVPIAVRQRFRKTLLIHSSDLPQGRGWSPQVWQVLEGRPEIIVTLLEAADAVDNGPVWRKERVPLAGHELHDEISYALYTCWLRLMDFAVAEIDSVQPTPQSGTPSYYRRRTPADSWLDPDKSLREQFDLLRVCDPVRFPAYFDLRGHRYAVKITKIGPAAADSLPSR